MKYLVIEAASPTQSKLCLQDFRTWIYCSHTNQANKTKQAWSTHAVCALGNDHVLSPHDSAATEGVSAQLGAAGREGSGLWYGDRGRQTRLQPLKCVHL